MSEKTPTKNVIMAGWISGLSLDEIVKVLAAAGKTLRNGNALSKTYVKAMIQALIKQGDLKKRPVILKEKI